MKTMMMVTSQHPQVFITILKITITLITTSIQRLTNSHLFSLSLILFILSNSNDEKVKRFTFKSKPLVNFVCSRLKDNLSRATIKPLLRLTSFYLTLVKNVYNEDYVINFLDTKTSDDDENNNINNKKNTNNNNETKNTNNNLIGLSKIGFIPLELKHIFLFSSFRLYPSLRNIRFNCRRDTNNDALPQSRKRKFEDESTNLRDTKLKDGFLGSESDLVMLKSEGGSLENVFLTNKRNNNDSSKSSNNYNNITSNADTTANNTTNNNTTTNNSTTTNNKTNDDNTTNRNTTKHLSTLLNHFLFNHHNFNMEFNTWVLMEMKADLVEDFFTHFVPIFVWLIDSCIFSLTKNDSSNNFYSLCNNNEDTIDNIYRNISNKNNSNNNTNNYNKSIRTNNADGRHSTTESYVVELIHTILNYLPTIKDCGSYCHNCRSGDNDGGNDTNFNGGDDCGGKFEGGMFGRGNTMIKFIHLITVSFWTKKCLDLYFINIYINLNYFQALLMNTVFMKFCTTLFCYSVFFYLIF